LVVAASTGCEAKRKRSHRREKDEESSSKEKESNEKEVKARHSFGKGRSDAALIFWGDFG
jgi:hypothetical protein